MKKRFFVIINPNAGKKKAQKDWVILSNLLTNNGFQFEFGFTSGRLDALNLALNAIANGVRDILAIGGDGTFNEIVNAIISQKICPSTDITIGLFGIGTGNDWCRTLKIPGDYNQALEIIKSGNILYLKNLLLCLLKSKIVNCEIKIDEEKINAEIFSMSVGIGKYNGGGMMQLPNAVPDDGLLDITLIKKISKFDVMKQTKNLYDGTFIKHPSVALYQGKKVEITSDTPINLELDGESVGHSPISFEILPNALKVFIP